MVGSFSRVHRQQLEISLRLGDQPGDDTWAPVLPGKGPIMSVNTGWGVGKEGCCDKAWGPHLPAPSTLPVPFLTGQASGSAWRLTLPLAGVCWHPRHARPEEPLLSQHSPGLLPLPAGPGVHFTPNPAATCLPGPVTGQRAWQREAEQTRPLPSWSSQAGCCSPS